MKTLQNAANYKTLEKYRYKSVKISSLYNSSKWINGEKSCKIILVIQET